MKFQYISFLLFLMVGSNYLIAATPDDEGKAEPSHLVSMPIKTATILEERTKDESRSYFEWAQKAANQGDINAQLKLGEKYYWGGGSY